ncbi:unnamed protein product [Adineta ricciae]|uniref:Calmodulin-lysine N-methyltransferase n=1 Tax=Adineta ricciae TaxID=249248 RepID=A0A814YU27_ADIRI|nr:unnamed protein product [Adineta ricciae]
MTELAKQRWRMLGEILLSKNLQSSSEHEDISVMRFKTYGLYLRSFSSASDNDDDDGTWCRIEFPSFEDNQSNILSLDIRLCSTKIEYADLIGFNNTGNTCKTQFQIILPLKVSICYSGIWPSEEVLAFYCLKEKEIFENRSVCELGGGMTCLAGLAVNLNQILKHKENQKNWLCPIKPKVLIWSRTLNDPTLKERFDFIISADCFFFENLHHDLCHTIYYMLKDSGVAINFAPYRSKTLNKFVSIAETYPFECRVLEHYDQEVFDKHLQCQQINKSYTSDLHYPILVILRKRSEK